MAPHPAVLGRQPERARGNRASFEDLRQAASLSAPSVAAFSESGLAPLANASPDPEFRSGSSWKTALSFESHNEVDEHEAQLRPCCVVSRSEGMLFCTRKSMSLKPNCFPCFV